jgi:hypothetical protein
MPKRPLKRTPKPTIQQAAILKQIARSRLIKTLRPDHADPLWTIDGGPEVPNKCAQALIRNGWLKANRDGLAIFDTSQTYQVLKP